jgi:SAM-dependent methyltransferase
MPDRAAPQRSAEVRAYWNHRIHDLEISSHPPGTPGFFADLDEYHFDKLHHLIALIDFGGFAGRRVLDVGCGTGVDLVRFVQGGAAATGVDIADSAIALAGANLRHRALSASLCVGDGERLPFADETFDFVFAHGVVQYAACDRDLVDECRRVLRPGGTAFFQVYNRISWLNALSRVMKVGLEHQDAPVMRMYSPREFEDLLDRFASVRVLYERFPVRSRLHGGWKGAIYNQLFVGTFNAIPRPLVRRFGWHLLAFCQR